MRALKLGVSVTCTDPTHYDMVRVGWFCNSGKLMMFVVGSSKELSPEWLLSITQSNACEYSTRVYCLSLAVTLVIIS